MAMVKYESLLWKVLQIINRLLQVQSYGIQYLQNALLIILHRFTFTHMLVLNFELKNKKCSIVQKISNIYRITITNLTMSGHVVK